MDHGLETQAKKPKSEEEKQKKKGGGCVETPVLQKKFEHNFITFWKSFQLFFQQGFFCVNPTWYTWKEKNKSGLKKCLQRRSQRNN